MKKILSVLLSVCMIMICSVPAFAYTSEAASKTAISDQEMAGVVGGSGSMDAKITAFSASTGLVEAVITNRSASTAHYELNIVQGASGEVVEHLASGSIANLGVSKVLQFTTANHEPNQGYVARIDLISDGLPGLNCSHASYSY